MRKPHVIILIVGVMLAVASFLPAASTAPVEKDPAAAVKIVCFGDSITEGYLLAHPAEESWPGVLQRLLDARNGKGEFTVVNAGISGQDTRQGSKRLDALLASEKPDWILMEYGTNDLWSSRHMAPWDTEKNLAEMLARMKAAGARVIVATLPPVGDCDRQVAERNQTIKKVAAEAGVPLVDINAFVEEKLQAAGGRDKKSSWETLYTAEDSFLHPNKSLASMLAERWLVAFDEGVAQGASKTSVQSTP
jgi:lysophospholipase L1-like esterase